MYWAKYKQANSQHFSTIVPSTKWDEYKQADQAFKVNIVALVGRRRKKKIIPLKLLLGGRNVFVEDPSSWLLVSLLPFTFVTRHLECGRLLCCHRSRDSSFRSLLRLRLSGLRWKAPEVMHGSGPRALCDGDNHDKRGADPLHICQHD